MSDEIKKIVNQKTNQNYQIRIKGHLGAQWAEWFDGLTITLENNGDTLLTGIITDQSKLHGLLKKIRDLGMPLISIADVNSDEVNNK